MKNLKLFKVISNDLPYKLITKDGNAIYCGPLFPESESDEIMEVLLQETLWKNDEVILYGKHFITNRKIAWYGNENFEYSYSNKTRTAIPWTKTILEIKKKVEKIAGTTYNSCLLNLYENGSQGLGWHSDKESLGADSSIASLSFGAERKFVFRHKESKEIATIILEHGSLLLMEGLIQNFWKHHLPKSLKIKVPRINMTFRKI